MNALRFGVAKTKFLEWVQSARSKATYQFYERFLTRAYLHFGDIDLRRLSPSAVFSWSQKFHAVVSVQRLMSWCHREARLIAVNPLEGMAKPPLGQRQRILSRVEQARCLRHSRAVFRRFLLLVRETLVRPQEARKLAWSDLRSTLEMGFRASELRFGVHFFALTRFKGKERRRDGRALRIIPVSPRLGRLLERLWGDGKPLDQPILLNSAGEPWTANAVRCRMRLLRCRVGLVTDQAGEKVVCYHWRHSGATEAAAAGIRDFVLAELLGHASTKTTARYVHLQPEHLRQAMETVRESRRRK